MSMPEDALAFQMQRFSVLWLLLAPLYTSTSCGAHGAICCTLVVEGAITHLACLHAYSIICYAHQ